MISLNLLPDVKKQFLKAQRTRNMIFTFSLIGSIISVGLVVLGFVAVLGMRFQINRNQDKISNLQGEYAQIGNLSQILTIRNQAEVLPDLHSEKPVANRLFNVLSISTPDNVSISEVNVDFVESSIEITAITDNFSNVNTYVDTLKNTLYTVASSEEKTPAFNEIVSEQSIDDDEVTVTVNMVFNPVIFDSASEVSFSVPDIETTQSVRQKPLFDEQTGQEDTDG